MRMYWIGTIFAAVVLSATAVWFGGLNQDEGWYLYAANLVAEGKMPYRDFFYTQGPQMLDIYQSFTWVWKTWGLLGARVFTLLIGLAGIVLSVFLARRLAPEGRRGEAALVVALLLSCNLYHLYYLAIPKTYALSSLFLMIGFLFLTMRSRAQTALAVGAGIFLACAAATRISLGMILPVVALWLLLARRWKELAAFCAGVLGSLALTYGPYFLNAGAREGVFAAQAYHAARDGFDITWTVGSLSRLVRWYLPLFVVLGLGVAGPIKSSGTAGTHRTAGTGVLLWGFLAVFIVQMLAPFPYEDYQVPIMGLLAVYAAVTFVSCFSNIQTFEHSNIFNILLVLGLCFANSFGSPLLEKWMMNGQDRFWSLKKEKCELAQLRDVARRIEAIDPGGKELLTQDLYLAIETNRRVPEGFEMGPFSYWGNAFPYQSERRIAFDDKTLRDYLSTTTVPIAALSGYSFAITVPECTETPIVRQMEYFEILKKNYKLVDQEELFGQNSTTLLVLKKK